LAYNFHKKEIVDMLLTHSNDFKSIISLCFTPTHLLKINNSEEEFVASAKGPNINSRSLMNDPRGRLASSARGSNINPRLSSRSSHINNSLETSNTRKSNINKNEDRIFNQAKFNELIEYKIKEIEYYGITKDNILPTIFIRILLRFIISIPTSKNIKKSEEKLVLDIYSRIIERVFITSRKLLLQPPQIVGNRLNFPIIYGQQLKSIMETDLFNNELIDNYLSRTIKVKYFSNGQELPGINAGGLTKDLFYNLQLQLFNYFNDRDIHKNIYLLLDHFHKLKINDKESIEKILKFIKDNITEYTKSKTVRTSSGKFIKEYEKIFDDNSTVNSFFNFLKPNIKNKLTNTKEKENLAKIILFIFKDHITHFADITTNLSNFTNEHLDRYLLYKGLPPIDIDFIMKLLLFSKKNNYPIFLDINIPIFKEIIECLLEIIKEENKTYKYKDVLCQLLVYTSTPDTSKLQELLFLLKINTKNDEKMTSLLNNLSQELIIKLQNAKTSKNQKNKTKEATNESELKKLRYFVKKAEKLLKYTSLNNNNLGNVPIFTEKRRENIEICKKYLKKAKQFNLYGSLHGSAYYSSHDAAYDCCLCHTKTEVVDYESFIKNYVINSSTTCSAEVLENFKSNFKILLEDMNRIDPKSIIDFAIAISGHVSLSSVYKIIIDPAITSPLPIYHTCFNYVDLNPITFAEYYFREGNNKNKNDERVRDFIKTIYLSLSTGFQKA
jgi:hypothetical protein